jgi:hypothetical protein
MEEAGHFLEFAHLQMKGFKQGLLRFKESKNILESITTLYF